MMKMSSESPHTEEKRPFSEKAHQCREP